MFGSLLILLALPVLDTSRIRGLTFRPLGKIAFGILVADFVLLGWLGSQHVEEPFITIGQFATAYYFAWFLIIVPLTGVLENTLMDLALDTNKND